jgi:MoxR-like ATPase
VTWTHYFDPDLPVRPELAPGDEQGLVYHYDEPTVLAVNVALVTGRPLLVRGPPGCGKSTLALSIARHMGWRYVEHIVTSRTQARDLLWTFDDVRRLADAQSGTVGPDAWYIEPGGFWWAVDASSAELRGAEALPPDRRATPPHRRFDPVDHAARGLPDIRWPDTVLLLDEIDKADPDVPNDLLGALDAYAFVVRGRVEPVHAARRPLVVLTTNDERELPGPFRRRCVIVDLPYPDAPRLEEVARLHLVHRGVPVPTALVARLAARTVEIADLRRRADQRPPGISEMLDALHALLGLVDDPATALDHPVAALVLQASLDKERGA